LTEAGQMQLWSNVWRWMRRKAA